MSKQGSRKISSQKKETSEITIIRTASKTHVKTTIFILDL